MPEGPRHRGTHLRRAGIGLLALLALAAVLQSWNHFSAGAVPRSNVARRVADLADDADPVSGPRLALAAADPASLEFTDVRVAEADAVPESRPSPPAEQSSSEEASVDVEPTPELSMAQAAPEMAVSPVDPGESDIGSAVEDPRPEGEGLSGTLAGASGDGSEGPLSGIGGGLGPLIGIIGGIALGGGSGSGPFIVLGGGSGCEGPSGSGIQLPGPIAAGPRRGTFEGPGPLGGNPTSGAPTIRIPTTVPADPSGIIGSGGRGFVPEAPDLGRTNEEASRSFGTRRTGSSFSSPAARQLQGSSATAANPAPTTMRDRVQRAMVRPTESRAARPQATSRLQPSVRTPPTRSTSRATQATSRAAQVRPSAPNRATRMARPAAAQARASGSAASAARRAVQARASAAARPTRALPSRRSQQ